jgi:ADP-ribose pyrophosphatase
MKNSKKDAIPMLQYSHEDVNVSAIETKYHGFFKLNEYKLNHKLFSKKQSHDFTREVFERGDAVVVILYDKPQDKLLLIEQFRAGALRAGDTSWMLEFVAGMFDDNESPIEVAIRETKEEANIILSADSVQPVMKFLPSPGGTSECIHLCWAPFDSNSVSPGSVFGLDTENEDILLHLVSRLEALTLLNEGKISNAATIIGLQWLAMNYQQL